MSWLGKVRARLAYPFSVDWVEKVTNDVVYYGINFWDEHPSIRLVRKQQTVPSYAGQINF